MARLAGLAVGYAEAGRGWRSDECRVMNVY